MADPVLFGNNDFELMGYGYGKTLQKWVQKMLVLDALPCAVAHV